MIKQLPLLMILNCGLLGLSEKTAEDERAELSLRSSQYLPPPAPINIFNPHVNHDCYGRTGYGCLPSPAYRPNLNYYQADPLVDAYLLSASLGLQQPARFAGFSHLEHLPLNPYLALLLSHYGKYAPIYGTGRGIYGYAAANNFHNNKPFGAYKIYDDRY